MKLATLIEPAQLMPMLGARDLLLVDCRFDLADPARGAREFGAAHLPGAVYASLDRDLSDLTKTGLGRHPLPDATAFAATLAHWGWTPTTRVVVYDEASGALAAARLWWMLRLAGAREVAVLDGGFAAWKAAGLPVEAGSASPSAAVASEPLQFDATQVVYSDALAAMLKNILLLDARAAPRFRGEVEPIDRVGGHIPGARNRPFSDNLDASAGKFKTASLLRAEFEALLGGQAPAAVVHSCGSGVTACHNLLAMEHAGLHGTRVYAPSWSGWIADPARPVERG